MTSPSKSKEAQRNYYSSNKTRIQKRRKYLRETDLESRLKFLLSNSRSRARQNGMGHSLTLDDLLNLWEHQSGLCALSGDKMGLKTSKKRHSSRVVSIDRINSAEGYTLDNCQLVTIQCNLAKASMSQEEFLNMCCRVSENSI